MTVDPRSNIFPQEPKYPITHQSHKDRLYALVDASLAIHEFGYRLNRNDKTWRLENLITLSQADLWNRHIAPQFVKINQKNTLTPAQRRIQLLRSLPETKEFPPSDISKLTLAFVNIWKEQTRLSLQQNKDYKRLLRRSKVPAGDPIAPYEEWRDLWVAVAHRQEILKAAAQQALVAETTRKELEAAAELEKLAAETEMMKQERERLEREAKQDYAAALRENYIATVEATTSGSVVPLHESQRDELETQHVKTWLEKEAQDRANFSPDEDQTRAISRVQKRLLIRARAGSGKTATIVARTVFLIKSCRVDPLEILLFAFNRDAAIELENRLTVALGLAGASQDEKVKSLPIVQTFDAFAQAISRRNPLQETELKKLTQGAIDELIQNHPAKVQAAMMRFFRGEWADVESGVMPGQAATLTQRRIYEPDGTRLTFGGEQVKSFGEHRIANWLFEHDIHYQYERNLRPAAGNWAPDFTLWPEQNNKVIVEYLGKQGEPEYDKKTQWKQARLSEIPEEVRPTALWLSRASVTEIVGDEYRFALEIKSALAPRNIILRKLTEDEIWERIKSMATSYFRKVVASVINRAQQLGWNARDLVDASAGSEVPELISLCAQAMNHMLEHNSSGDLSYPEICWAAIEELQNAEKSTAEVQVNLLNKILNVWRECDITKIQEVIVDEFQDYSLRFHLLTEGVLGLAQTARFVGVGDDWQAINRYAGSDPKYITEWAGSQVVLPTNYRSLPPIVKLGNSLMEGRGPLARHQQSSESATVLRMEISSLNANTLETNLVKHLGEIRPEVAIAISRLAAPAIKEGKSIAVLARTKSELQIPDSSEKESPLKKWLVSLSGVATAVVAIKTVHGFKGLQADVVILLSDNFPLLHPLRVVYEIFGDTAEQVLEDERRLLYVGITRAKSALYLISGTKMRSQPLANQFSMGLGSWQQFPLIGEHAEATAGLLVVVRGWATLSIKEALKSAKFKWQPKPLNRWERVALEAEEPAMALAEVVKEPWFPSLPLERELIIEVLNIKGQVLKSQVIPAGKSASQP